MQGILDREDFCAPAKVSGDDSPPQPDKLVIDVDLHGVIWSSYLALHYFRKNASKAGKLAMTSSSAGIYACSEIPLYAAAKHGVSTNTSLNHGRCWSPNPTRSSALLVVSANA